MSLRIASSERSDWLERELPREKARIIIEEDSRRGLDLPFFLFLGSALITDPLLWESDLDPETIIVHGGKAGERVARRGGGEDDGGGCSCAAALALLPLLLLLPPPSPASPCLHPPLPLSCLYIYDDSRALVPPTFRPALPVVLCV